MFSSKIVQVASCTQTNVCGLFTMSLYSRSFWPNVSTRLGEKCAIPGVVGAAVLTRLVRLLMSLPPLCSWRCERLYSGVTLSPSIGEDDIE